VSAARSSVTSQTSQVTTNAAQRNGQFCYNQSVSRLDRLVQAACWNQSINQSNLPNHFSVKSQTVSTATFSQVYPMIDHTRNEQQQQVNGNRWTWELLYIFISSINGSNKHLTNHAHKHRHTHTLYKQRTNCVYEYWLKRARKPVASQLFHVNCNYHVGHYSGFSRISPSILNRFTPNLQA